MDADAETLKALCICSRGFDLETLTGLRTRTSLICDLIPKQCNVCLAPAGSAFVKASSSDLFV